MKEGDRMDYYAMYRDIWLYHKHFIDKLDDSDEFWATLIRKGGDLSKKYNDCDFINALIATEFEEFERLYEQKYKKG